MKSLILVIWDIRAGSPARRCARETNEVVRGIQLAARLDTSAVDTIALHTPAYPPVPHLDPRHGPTDPDHPDDR
jgi:hypothetical protein